MRFECTLMRYAYAAYLMQKEVHTYCWSIHRFGIHCWKINFINFCVASWTAETEWVMQEVSWACWNDSIVQNRVEAGYRWAGDVVVLSRPTRGLPKGTRPVQDPCQPNPVTGVVNYLCIWDRSRITLKPWFIGRNFERGGRSVTCRWSQSAASGIQEGWWTKNILYVYIYI